MYYIYQHKNWPAFTWDNGSVTNVLANVRHKQGRLKGYTEALGFDSKNHNLLETLTLDVLKSSEIEGEILNSDQVRSSIARKLGLDIAGLIPSDRLVDGVVEMTLDATQNHEQKLTKKRLFQWHTALFPSVNKGPYDIMVGEWRDSSKGPMQVVSGPMGREKVHFQAPEADVLEKEINLFLKWFNAKQDLDPVLKAAIAHVWFVTIHPFDDGNGRISRAITDMQLARSDGDSQRFYSMSAQIRVERKGYYEILEKTQKGKLDITPWLLWFLNCMEGALNTSEKTFKKVLHKAQFWDKHAKTSINERQRLLINKLFDGFEGHLTSTKWGKIAKCSPDTALRDIQDLMEKKILKKAKEGGRSTHYVL